MRKYWIVLLIVFGLLGGCANTYTYNSKTFDSPNKALVSQVEMYEGIQNEIGMTSAPIPETLYIVLPDRNEIESRGVIKKGNPDLIIVKYLVDSQEKDLAWMAKLASSYNLFSNIEIDIDRYPDGETGLVLFFDYDKEFGTPWVLATTDMLERRPIRFGAAESAPADRVRSWLKSIEKEAKYLISIESNAIENKPSQVEFSEIVEQDESTGVSNGSNGSVGDWTVKSSVNPIDDSKTVTIILHAEEGQRGGLSDLTVPLIIRCKSGETDLYVSWGDYLGSSTRVTSRIGNSKAKTARWSLSTDKSTSFYPGDPVPFIKRLMRFDRLVLQTTPYNESPVTAIFAPEGIREAIKPVRNACRW